MKYYTVHCMDCMCVLGISKKKTWDKEIRCMRCGKIEINNHQEKNAIAICDSNAEKGTTSLPLGQRLGENPQDDTGQTSGVANGDTGNSTFPADYKSDKAYEEGMEALKRLRQRN